MQGIFSIQRSEAPLGLSLGSCSDVIWFDTGLDRRDQTIQMQTERANTGLASQRGFAVVKFLPPLFKGDTRQSWAFEVLEDLFCAGSLWPG